MGTSANETATRPPLMLLWRTTTSLTQAVASPDGLYGVDLNGHLVAMRGTDRSTRWRSTGQYLQDHLVRQGTRLFAYKVGEGLAFVDDAGTAPNEQVRISFGAVPTSTISDPILDDQYIYLIVNQGLYLFTRTKDCSKPPS